MMASAPTLRHMLAAGATAVTVAAASFAFMDADPSLFLFDKLWASQRRLERHFAGKTMLIVGASSGIGACLAQRLSSYGANVILSSRPSDRLNEAKARCQNQMDEQSKNWAKSVALDITDETKLDGYLDDVMGCVEDDNIDCVILNAGIGQLRPADQTSREETLALFRVNSIAPITLTQMMLRRGILSEANTKHMVVTSSVGGKFGIPLSASYAATKHAVHGYFNSIRAEFPWLRVDLCCPGPIKTDFFKNSNAKVPGAKDGSSAKEMKMPVERCAALIISSMVMENGYERWIAQQPTLLGMFINQFFPSLFLKLSQSIGPLRVAAWKDGKNIYDIKELRSMSKKKK